MLEATMFVVASFQNIQLFKTCSTRKLRNFKWIQLMLLLCPSALLSWICFLERTLQVLRNKQKRDFSHYLASWWFQPFFIFTPIWGNDPIWLIFFKRVGSTTNQLGVFFSFDKKWRWYMFVIEIQGNRSKETQQNWLLVTSCGPVIMVILEFDGIIVLNYIELSYPQMNTKAQKVKVLSCIYEDILWYLLPEPVSNYVYIHILYIW